MRTINISVLPEIKDHCPQFVGAAIHATVTNSGHNDDLWHEINLFMQKYRSTYIIEDIKQNKAISATRTAYKSLGKDPNRYRPSSEALLRRTLRDIPLYEVNTLVDLINLVSMHTGYSIGGFDADKIMGNNLELGVGKAEEPYEGIGKGLLNIEGLPVYRDAEGGVGTPTSDNERTKIDVGTTHFLAIINAYSGEEELENAVIYMQSLLVKFTDAKDIAHSYF